MKKKLAILLSAAMLAGALTGCGGDGGSGNKTRTPEELTELYSAAITDARDQEMNDINPVVTDSDGQNYELIMQVTGLNEEDMTAYAVSVSLMMVQAYGIAAVMPAEGREEAVTEALQGFIDNTKTNFEFYLPEPYDIACAARLETLSDGTVLMVMCEDQDAVFDAISSAIVDG